MYELYIEILQMRVYGVVSYWLMNGAVPVCITGRRV